MFASMCDWPYDGKSQTDTARFLAELGRADKLECADGMYTIKA